jgi:adenosylcobinamide-phosphate synthase
MNAADRRGLEPLALLPLALAWDTLLGELPARLHPVVWMGNIARAGERRAPVASLAREFAYGAVLALPPPVVYAAATAAGLRRLRQWPAVAFLVSVPLLKSTFAVRALRQAGEGVRRPLLVGDLAGAREGLRSLVSRDPSALDAGLIMAAAVESLAENLGDSVVAPLFYYALGGLPAALAYRAVNTLDAMIGYRGRYEWLGKPAARLDDLLNLVPARLAALLLIGAAAMLGEDARNAWRTARSEARHTASPNAGWPMAAMAGALGVRLEKTGHYALCGGAAPMTPATIGRADRLIAVAAGAAGALAWLARWALVRRRGW